MGLTYDGAIFFQHCKENGINFESTLQVGRQQLYFSYEKLGLKRGNFAEPFFQYLGAKKVDSLDYSDFEQASIIHDMNLPINEKFKEHFSVVIDGGTLEHVFNYPVAVKNCMEMVKIGGHLILATPGNNWLEHGLYQFSPNLFFSLLREQHGFAETQIFAQFTKITRNGNGSCQWFKIQPCKNTAINPDLYTTNNKSLMLFVISKKIKSTPKELNVSLGFYIDLWENKTVSDGDEISKKKKDGLIKSFVKTICKIIIPCGIRRIIGEIRHRKNQKKLFYKKINFRSSLPLQ
jgi:hypothetical protein